MRNRLLLILILLIASSACDKVKSTQKKLAGEWSIYEYKYINTNGLTYYYPASGVVSFSNCSEGTCDYVIDMDYVIQGTTYQKNESGALILQDNSENFDLHRTNPDGSITILLDGRIILINSNDLKIQFSDETGLHGFILEK
jgi:type 1 fimbria pilin